jgi:carboxypeptidase family protein
VHGTHTSFLGTTLLICLGVVFSGQTAFAQSRVGGVSSELNGQVRNVCGRAISGATVRIDNPSGATFRVYTGVGGRYVFHGVPSTGDSWVLTAEIVGFEKERQEDIRLKDGARLEHNIRLVRDLSLKETLTATHGDPNAHFHRYSAVGMVTDPNGSPVPGATVTLRDSGSATGVPPFNRCTTDELGRYDVSQVLATSARWVLSVESQGLAPCVQSDIELQPDEPQVIKINLRSR